MSEAHDGITELDNDIPAWLAYLLYATIVFAFGYGVIYPSFWFWGGTSRWSSTQGQDEAPKPKVAVTVKADLATLARDEKRVTAGTMLFAIHCATCHGESAEGKIGPNLTDAEWKFGDEPEEIVASIAGGRPGGMPAWGNVLKPEELTDVAAYIYSLRASRDQAHR